MSNKAAAPEQSESMEDILHSIRKIIANEPEAPGASAAAEEEPLELTEVVEEKAQSAPPAAAAPPPPPPPPPAAEAAAAAPAPQPAAPTPAPAPAAPATTPAANNANDSLIANNVAEASAHALKNLVNSIPQPKIDSPSLRSGSTLEDLVVERLKPQLSNWLNQNLPVLVQKLVEKEIRKLVPRD